MPLLNAQHWLVATGETWSTISTATGVSKAKLAKANAGTGYTYNGSAFNKQPVVDEMVHVPLSP